MGVLKYFKDAISGKIKHWNETNNAVVGEMWNKAKELDGINGTLFKHFIVSSGIIVEDLMGMSKDEQIDVRIDYKKIDAEKFRQLYTIILTYFSFLFNITNRKLKEDVKKSLVEVTNKPEIVQRIFQRLSKHYSKSTGEVKINLLGGKIWNEIVELIGFDKEMGPEQRLYFIMILEGAYKEAVKSVKAELNL